MRDIDGRLLRNPSIQLLLSMIWASSLMACCSTLCSRSTLVAVLCLLYSWIPQLLKSSSFNGVMYAVSELRRIVQTLAYAYQLRLAGVV